MTLDGVVTDGSTRKDKEPLGLLRPWNHGLWFCFRMQEGGERKQGLLAGGGN